MTAIASILDQSGRGLIEDGFDEERELFGWGKVKLAFSKAWSMTGRIASRWERAAISGMTPP